MPAANNASVSGSGTCVAQLPRLIAKLPTPHSQGSTMTLVIEPQLSVVANPNPGVFVALNENDFYAC